LLACYASASGATISFFVRISRRGLQRIAPGTVFNYLGQSGGSLTD
jgi:hypothetical protein